MALMLWLDWVNDDDEQLQRWPVRLQVLTEAAVAISYLHGLASGAVLHNDLPADNMLLQLEGETGACTLKLADFGLAVRMPDASDSAIAADASCIRVPSRHMTNHRWVAPEVLACTGADDGCVDLSTACDVYSLAAVMSEVMTAEVPHCPQLDDECRAKPHFHKLSELVSCYSSIQSVGTKHSTSSSLIVT
jgi:serine/threonine protein kinase